MKTFFSLIVVNLRQAILSWRFLFSVFGVALVMTFAAWSWITNSQEFTDVVYLYTGGTSGGSLFLLTGVLPIFAFATTFASEWGQKATSFWMIRTGIRKYSISKVIVTAISGFLTTAVGFLLFILLMWIKFPLLFSPSSGDAYAVLLENGEAIKYLMYHITHVSLTSALFEVIALWVSTYIPNTFVAIASPLIVYFITHRFTTQLDIPEYLKAMWVVESIYHAGTPMYTLLLKLGIVLALCTLMGVGTIWQIRRRVYNA